MSDVTLRPPAKYMTEIKNVREVSLFGAADLAFWRERLRGEKVIPYDDWGKAQVLISAVASKWMGISFRELSISVAICDREVGDQHNGFYLAHAFNSSRVLALAERAFFQTPYYLGNIEVEEQMPVTVTLRDGPELRFKAQMAGKTSPTRSGEEVWEGPIFLPGRMAKTRGRAYLFYARLAGLTKHYPFLPADKVELHPPASEGIIQSLSLSNFTGQEWLIRGNATHAKGQTVQR